MGTLQRPSRDPLPTVPVVGSLLRPDALGDKRHSGRGSATFWNTFSIVPRVRAYTPTYGMIMMMVLFCLQAGRGCADAFLAKAR